MHSDSIYIYFRGVFFLDKLLRGGGRNRDSCLRGGGGGHTCVSVYACKC